MEDSNPIARDKLAQLSPAHQLALVRALVDSTPHAVIAHEPDGAIVYYSPKACDLLGMTAEQIENLEPFGWVGPESLRGGAERLETILYDGQLTFRSTAQRPDGTLVNTEVFARRVDTEIGPLIVAVIRDIESEQSTQERMAYLAYHDALTGLPNRTAFSEQLDRAIAGAVRHGDLLVVAYIDLDDFKPLNDRFGHEAGDAVLTELGHRLVGVVRVQDMVARIGGDEFVVILQRVESLDEIPGIARRFMEVIREPVETCGTSCHVDASIGFASFNPELDDARSIVVKADVAMYAAKKDPEHPWCVYEPDMGTAGFRGVAGP